VLGADGLIFEPHPTNPAKAPKIKMNVIQRCFMKFLQDLKPAVGGAEDIGKWNRNNEYGRPLGG
jgi:hypothetical protein